MECGFKTGRVFICSLSLVFVSYASVSSTPRRRSHLDVLLHAELRQRLFDAQGRQSGRSVGVPALPHDLTHHAQRLQEREHRLEVCFSIQPLNVSAAGVKCSSSEMYLVALPPVGHIRPEFLVTHHLPHLLYGGVRGYEVVVGQLVLLVDTCGAQCGSILSRWVTVNTG